MTEALGADREGDDRVDHVILLWRRQNARVTQFVNGGGASPGIWLDLASARPSRSHRSTGIQPRTGDDDARRRPHQAERLARHGTDLLTLGQRAILRRKPLETAAVAAEPAGLVALAIGPGALTRTPRPAPK